MSKIELIKKATQAIKLRNIVTKTNRSVMPLEIRLKNILILAFNHHKISTFHVSNNYIIANCL